MSVVGDSLSSELWLEILRHFVPSGAPTTMAIQSSKVELRPHVLEYRRTLWAACLVSRQVGACARNYLYQAILINDCKELLYVFRTLCTVPELRALVRSFSWTGTLPQSDSDETECVDLMPSLVTVSASLLPLTKEDAVLHQFLDVDNLTAFRAWRLLSVVLAIIPKLTTLFLALGRLMPGPIFQQHLIDTALGGGGTAEQRERLFLINQNAYEFFAIRALVTDPILTSIGYPLLPELQVLILDHISDKPNSFYAFNSGLVIDFLGELCPQLRYIQTKDSMDPPHPREPVRSTSMRSLLVRRQLHTLSRLPDIQAAYPNLTSLRIVACEYNHNQSLIDPLAALAKLQHLQYLSITTPHDLAWLDEDPHLTMSHFLRRMKSLQHLRVDFIWLAARNSPSQLFHIASLLPPSIRSLHLLDYWAFPMTGACGDKYPVFPDNKSAAEFMRMMLENLLQSYSSMGLTSLKEVKLSSREYSWDRSRWTGARRSLNRLIWRFSQAGILLKVTGLEEARDEEDGWWLNLE
ncbi:hypothetical protein HD806DRAFT_153214 [Xylariaceae sp. AK1471]|nr:hypothetical protein HD806DRAFT_153214 [Xylariaceae sp. AK1471]